MGNIYKAAKCAKRHLSEGECGNGSTLTVQRGRQKHRAFVEIPSIPYFFVIFNICANEEATVLRGWEWRTRLGGIVSVDGHFLISW